MPNSAIRAVKIKAKTMSPTVHRPCAKRHASMGVEADLDGSTIRNSREIALTTGAGLINLVFFGRGCHFRRPIACLPAVIAILASDEAAHYIYGEPDPHRA